MQPTFAFVEIPFIEGTKLKLPGKEPQKWGSG